MTASSKDTVTVVIVQARLNSSRLPGKVLMDLAGQSVLSHVLERCAAIPGVDMVCCATVTGEQGEPIAEEAVRCGAEVYCGSETDVLTRYAEAARMLGATTVMRVTSDCPAIDPVLCGDVIAALDDECEYACNFLPPTWPHGLDCDAFSMALLERTHAQAVAIGDREHVTPLMRRFDDVVKRNVACPVDGLTRQRWTLDTANDLTFLREVFAGLPPGPGGWSYTRVVERLAADPALLALNRADVVHRGPLEPDH